MSALAANGSADKPLWLETPLIYSPHISARLDCDVYLKLENLQRAHSYKARGISHFVQRAARTHGPGVHLVIASGGNAGLAAACAAHALNVRCTVVLPEDASPSTVEFLKREGAEVVIEGRCYAQALGKAREIVQAESDAVMVPAYDDPILWEGHASMVAEMAQQLPPGTTPDAIFCSVGGGGLLGGIIQGCNNVGWQSVPLVALETHGSNCFYESVALNRGFSRAPRDGIAVIHDEEHGVKVAHLAKLTSKATSLGASAPSAGVVKMALRHKGGVKSVSIPDVVAMQSGMRFADEHKIMVELACATTLAPAYWGGGSGLFFEKLVPPRQDQRRRTVVFVVCGGFKISLADMEKYRIEVEAEVRSGGLWNILCNGEQWDIQPTE